MARGRRRHDWHRTLELMALTANCHRDPKAVRRAFTAAGFAAELGFWWLEFAGSAERPREVRPCGPAEVALLESLFPPKQEAGI